MYVQVPDRACPAPRWPGTNYVTVLGRSENRHNLTSFVQNKLENRHTSQHQPAVLHTNRDTYLQNPRIIHKIIRSFSFFILQNRNDAGFELILFILHELQVLLQMVNLCGLYVSRYCVDCIELGLKAVHKLRADRLRYSSVDFVPGPFCIDASCRCYTPTQSAC